MTQWDKWLLWYLDKVRKGEIKGNFRTVYNFTVEYFGKWHPEGIEDKSIIFY